MIDSREGGLGELVRKELESRGLHPKDKTLDHGDYAVMDEKERILFLVEAKFLMDFVISALPQGKSGHLRLLWQAERMKEPNSFIAIVGGESVRDLLMNPECRWDEAYDKPMGELVKIMNGTLTTIEQSLRIPIRFFNDEKDFCDWFLSSMRKIGKPILALRKKCKAASPALNVLTSIEGIGIKGAEKLLKKHGTIKNMLSKNPASLGLSAKALEGWHKVFGDK